MIFVSTLHKVWTSLYGNIFLVLGALCFVFVECRLGRNDLDIFLAASSDLFCGKDIYTTTYFDGYHYFYSVFFASIIWPLTFIPIWLSKAIWLVLNLIFLWRIFKICLFYLHADWLKNQMKTMFVFLLFIFCLRFIRANLHLGQMTIVMLYLSLEALYQIQYGKKYVGGFLLSLAINIKLMPLVLIPYFIYRREWRVALFAVFCLVVLFMLPAIWLGMETNTALLTSWFDLINPQQDRHILDVEETSFHGLTTLLATLLIENTQEKYGLTLSRNVAGLSVEQLSHVILVVRLLFVVGTLWFLRSRPFTAFGSNRKTWWEVSYLLLIVPLIFPHQQHYAFLMGLPAVGYVLHWILNPGSKSTWLSWIIGCCILIYLTFSLNLLLGVFDSWYNHFKILTYGALMLVIVLCVLIPESEDKSEIC